MRDVAQHIELYYDQKRIRSRIGYPTPNQMAARTETRTGQKSVPPLKQAALKCVYLAVIAVDPTDRGRARWPQCWKQALNAFDMVFDRRLTAEAHDPPTATPVTPKVDGFPPEESR